MTLKSVNYLKQIKLICGYERNSLEKNEDHGFPLKSKVFIPVLYLKQSLSH